VFPGRYVTKPVRLFQIICIGFYSGSSAGETQAFTPQRITRRFMFGGKHSQHPKTIGARAFSFRQMFEFSGCFRKTHRAKGGAARVEGVRHPVQQDPIGIGQRAMHFFALFGGFDYKSLSE